MKHWTLCQVLLVSASLLQALHLLHHPASCATVAGCDGHPCSTGGTSKPLFQEEQYAVVFSRCHATCADMIVAAGLMSFVGDRDTAWPVLPLENIEASCIEMRKLVECRRGCIFRKLNGYSASACRGDCRDGCISECPSVTGCYYNDTRCQFSCYNMDGCRMGCKIKLDRISTGGPPPSVPPASLMLTETSEMVPRPPGHYDIAPYPVPASAGANGDHDIITGFLFKLEVNSTNLFLYQTSLSGEVLNLSYLACQNVRVSFSVVNKYNASAFSPVTELCVHGASRYPSQLTNADVRYSLAPDNREGYQDNAVVNISWNKPTEAHLVTHYELILFTNVQNCTDHASEREHYGKISGEASYFVVKALHPERLPRILCVYQFILQVFPNNTADYARGAIDIRDPANVIPELIMECSTSINESTGLISAMASWSPQQYRAAMDAIGSYTVVYSEVNWSTGHPEPQIILIERVMPDQNASASYISTGLTPNPAEEARIKITVTPELPAPSSSSETFHHVPKRKDCLLRALPHAPGKIDSDSIEVHTFSSKPEDNQRSLRMNVTWEEPDEPYGTITSYQVRLLQQKTGASDEVEAARTHVNMAAKSGEMITFESTNISSPCLQIQVRAKNQYYWGNWSGPAKIPDMYTSCNALDPSTQGLRYDPLLPLVAWIGIGVAGCALLALCVLCAGVCVCICRRHRMKVQMKRAFENGYSNPMFVAGGRALRRRNSSMRMPLTLSHGSIELDDWELPVGSVIVDTKFGEGCFGEVHKGVVRGPLPSTRTMKSNICVTVAIKMLKSSATGSERTDFLHEIDTMKKIAEGNNPHVITFVGCVTVQEPLCLITEFVKYGDLLSYLETIRKLVTHKSKQMKFDRLAALKEPEPYLEPNTRRLAESGAALVLNELLQGGVEGGVEGDLGGEKELGAVVPSPDSPYAPLGGVEPVNLISFAYQIASGMEYLSSLDIVHRDMACRNILIGENKNLKISDFGMSRVVSGDDIYVKTTKGRLPWKWMAIESIVNREFTHASDVWSYGVTLWEIATLGGFPYPMISNAELLDHLNRGFRLECPENCSPEIYKVMLECWNDNPNDRKDFTELRSLFDAMLAEDNPYIQFENINAHKPYYNTSHAQAQGQSHRNSASEDEQMVGLSGSEIDFEPLSTSTSTLNGAPPTGAYDFLRPLVPTVEVSDAIEEHRKAIQAANPYVETPTFKFLMSQDSFELSTFELELQRSDEMESSGEVQVEIDSSANSAIAVE